MFVRLEIALCLLLSLASDSNAQLNIGEIFRTLRVIGQILFPSNDSNHKDVLDCPVIKTTLGDIAGIRQDTVFGKNTFCSYRGIRYAEAPIGELRFKAPVKARPWRGTYNAYSYGAACFQEQSANYPKISEDCLFLNVFVPSSSVCSNSSDIAVIVTIHGGAFIEGAANDAMYGPFLLMNDCIILVTLNYRLGAFGFLPLALAEYSGNMALKDQQLALKWVNEHIAAFGGNPRKITLLGQSAGSASVSHHRLNGKSRSLFKQAYAMSGSSLSYYALDENNNKTDLIVRIAREQFVFIRNTVQLIDYVKKVDASYLLRRTAKFGLPGMVFEVPWKPCIEPEIVIDPFITEDPEILLLKGVNVPTVYTHTSMEYITFSIPTLVLPDTIAYLNLDFKFKLPFHGLDQEACKKELTPLFADIRAFYFGNEVIDGSQIIPYIQLVSYLNLGYSIQKEVAIQAQSPYGTKIKFLRANQRTQLNNLLNFPGVAQLAGVGHGEDLCYYFWCSILSKLFHSYEKITPRKTLSQKVSFKMSKIYREILVNYAKSGNPISETAAKDSLTSSASSQSLTELRYSDFLTNANPNHEEFLFWSNLDKRVQEIKKMPCNQK